MKRNLYTFGCSFTEHTYPTYADYLAPYFDYHYNYGYSGSGNRSIFAKLGKLLAENKITEFDTVIIQWSSIPREDRIFDGRWTAGGIIDNTGIYSDQWVEDYFQYTQQTIELIAYIRSILPAVREVTKEFKWFYMLEPWIHNNLGEPGFTAYSLKEKYKDFRKTNLMKTLKSLSIDKDYLGSIEGFYVNNDEFKPEDRIAYCNDQFEIIPDDHPTQIIHHAFSKEILKSLGYEKLYHEEYLKQNALEWTSYIQDPKRIYDVEKKFFDEHQQTIGYWCTEQPGAPKWPSNNVTKIVKDV